MSERNNSIKNNYIVIQGWMVTELNLSGNDLLVFALINGFSQDGESEFTGSIKYVCDWLNCSRPTAIKALQNLSEKNLLIKQIAYYNNVQFNRYKVNLQVVKNINRGSKESLQGGKETLEGGSKEPLHNKDILYKDNNKDNNIKEQKIDFSDMLIFLDIFSCIKSGVLEQEESIRQEWIKLTEAERQKAIEWARKVQEYRTPEQYVKNPVFLLRYKDFNSPPHRHVENTMAVGAKMTKEEKYAEIMPYCSSTLTIDNVASNFLNRTVEETLDLIMRGEYGKVKSTAARLLAKKYPQVQALFDADYLLDTKFGKKL